MEKLTLASLDAPSITVVAQYNPNELVVDQAFAWNDHPVTDRQESGAGWLEFGGMQRRTLKLDLLFDGFERDGRLADGGTVMDAVGALKRLASVREPYARDPELRRPFYCILVWGGPSAVNVPTLRCVIESLSTKFQMFAASGAVLRATVTVALKEADRVAAVRAARR